MNNVPTEPADVPLDYLRGPLTEGKDLAPAVHAMTRTVAMAWRAHGIDPAVLEVASELLARVASELGEEQASWAELEEVCSDLDLHANVRAWLAAALATPRRPTEVAALAVHLVDVAEVMALAMFVPELPRLAAKSDRTGDAARNVGVARHLRG